MLGSAEESLPAPGATSPSASNSELADTFAERGKTLAENGKLNEAITNLSRAILLNPDDYTSLINLGHALFLKAHYGEAIAMLSRAISLTTNQPIAYNIRGRAFSERNEIANALADFNSALRLSPTNALFYNNRGVAYLKKGSLKQAIHDFTEGLRFDPNNGKLLTNRGKSLIRAREFAAASVDLHKAILRGPRDAEANNALAWMLATSPDPGIRNGKSAREYATKACELTNWKNRYCLGTLAASCAEDGDFTNAIRYQEEAIDAGGANPEEIRKERDRLLLFEQNRPYHDSGDLNNKEFPP